MKSLGVRSTRRLYWRRQSDVLDAEVKSRRGVMVEFHGWATIRFSAENRDREDEEQLQDAAIILWLLGTFPRVGNSRRTTSLQL
jgi:hypothetical protein